MRSKAGLDAAIANGERLVAQIKESAARGEYVEDALQKILPPAPQLATAWRRAVIRRFEEIDLRKQFGMMLHQ